MKIIIDIGHPAHVHLFKNFAWQMLGNGHEILFTTRDKEHEVYLLNTFGFSFKSFGKHYKSTTGKIIGLLRFNLKMLSTALSFKPDIFLSHGSIYAAHISRIVGKPHISFEDTGNMEQLRLYLPFTEVVLTSFAFHKELGEKQIKYNGYHELAYLHPSKFKVDKTIRKLIGLKQNENFSLLRFVSWNASHDMDHKGLSLDKKKEIIEKLSNYGEVRISSEEELPYEFIRYKIIIPPEKIHYVLAEANLLVSEGATMSSECAMLGTPAIYVNPIESGTIDEQEKYGLLYHFRNSVGVLEKAMEILNNPYLKNELKIKRDEMIKEKIDVTAFLVWFVETYPESVRIMKENPDYQLEFR